jgi:hypothetical protein
MHGAGQTSSAPSGDITGIRVRTNLLTGLVAFPAHPWIGIDDGEPDQMLGRDEFFTVEPGWRKVRCFIQSSNTPRFLRLHDSSTKVHVPRGCIVSLQWSSPAGFFGGGRFRIVHTE